MDGSNPAAARGRRSRRHRRSHSGAAGGAPRGRGTLGWARGLAAVLALGLAAASPGAVGGRAGAEAALAPSQIVAVRRLTEAQYRNSIADIFGADVKVAGRFEPIVRPTNELLATGASAATISPAGIEQFDAIGRAIAAQVFDQAHRPLFVPCAPRDAKAPDEACALATLSPLGRALFRRPLTAHEQAQYVRIAGEAATQTGSFDAGLELALSAMLISPNFLYVVERGAPDPDHPGDMRLDDYSRAARLSFLLWNTTPDEALLKAAGDGRLMDQAQLTQIASRMVKSPRLADGVRAFFSDMLLFEKFDELQKDSLIYPRFNTAVGSALAEQMLRTVVDHLVTRNGDYRELFTTRRTFMTRTLGPLYNVPVRAAQGWEPYEFPPGDERAGLLGQAGFLAIYSHSGRSSATLRGRAIRELLMCQPVPNPPGNVDFTAVQDTSNKAMPTARVRLAAHANDPVCSSCHRITDPIGLSLEKFDGIGAFRATENGAAIDASGSLEGVRFDSAAGFGEALSGNPAVTQCVAGRALEYATGRYDDTGRAQLASALEKSFAADGYRIPALFLRIATLPDAYRIRPRPPAAPAVKVAALDPTNQARPSNGAGR